MAQFYKVIKDHPMWDEGAILSNEEDSDRYYPIDEVFVKDIEGISSSWYEGGKLIENQSEWFQKVYPITGLKKKIFGTREQAKATAAALYEEKN